MMRLFFLSKINWPIYVIVFLLLGIMFFLGFMSMKDDSENGDEVLHVNAGYSYLTRQDYRLNPEHPPIIKDFAAIPLLFLDLNFVDENSYWNTEINRQHILGPDFFYHSGNDPNQIIFWSRLPMLFVMVFLGFFIFYWAKKLTGSLFGLITLILFSFSPNFLAHGRLVTTDVGATLGFVIAIYFYLKFLDNPSFKNILLAGCSLGFAILTKFSTFILIPFFVFLTIIYVHVQIQKGREKDSFIKYLFFGLLVFLVALVVVGIVYQLHMINYPVEKQISDSEEILARWCNSEPSEVNYEFADNVLIRPYAHYFMGLLRTVARVNTTGIIDYVYFWGEAIITNCRIYFPALYLFKIPLGFHLLSLISLITVFYLTAKKLLHGFDKVKWKLWLKKHFHEFSMLSFVVMYSFIAIMSPISIGFRHFIPVLPFIYILVVIIIKKWFQEVSFPNFETKIILIFSLLLWYVLSSIYSFPHYLSYYNELAGGIHNGYKISADLNYDWGKDLKRLTNWVDDNEIQSIYLDYFGTAEPEYYLGEKYIPWKESSWWKYYGIEQDNHNDFPRGNYFAVSVTFLVIGELDDNLSIKKDYTWLDDHRFVGRVGSSIFVYYIN